MAGTSIDLLEYAQRCTRLARLITDVQIRLELEQLAEQLEQEVRHLEVATGPAVSGHEPRV